MIPVDEQEVSRRTSPTQRRIEGSRREHTQCAIRAGGNVGVVGPYPKVANLYDCPRVTRQLMQQ